MLVDFGTGSVNEMHITADTMPSGMPVVLSGHGTVDADGDIDIDTLSGTVNGAATQDSSTGAGGVVVGPEAEGVAGGWHASDGVHNYAAGEFHMKR